MADVINLMSSPVVVAPSGVRYQPVEQAIDVSGYDHIDLAIDTPGAGPNEVKILTSMTLQETDADWVEAAVTTGAVSSNTANTHLAVPASGKPLFRYIRWKITAGANPAATYISGMARRG
ncbi:MAG: hypothetical protein ACOYN0_16505 [Phycisphaerales bacterium]